MTDYEALGFKAGLEIHQQLAGKKLFCSCPCDIRKDKPDFTITRRLRASAGETGEIDQAASHEQKKAKQFIYQAYDDTTCLVEFDEEPPHPINQDALRTCLSVCKLLHADIPTRIQFMRKVVIDGSNVSGFQRTALVGRNGHLTLSSGKRVTVPTVCLEEEACQPIKREKDCDIYNLSRLGMPLIEIATGPDLEDPEEAKEAAEKFGMILRSVPGMKRGIGTIRQDVNVSIKGGSRVEIKGFQDYKRIPKVIANEIERQQKILKTEKNFKPEVRAAKEDFTTSFLRPMPGASRMYPETDLPIIEISAEDITVGKTLDEQEQDLMVQFNIQKEFAKQIIRQNIDLEKYVLAYKNIPPSFIAETIINTPKEIKARYKKDINAEEHLDIIFSLLDQGKIPKSAVFEILVAYAQGNTPDLSSYGHTSNEEIERIIIDIIQKNQSVSVQGLMGLAMAKLRGKADGKVVMELIKKHTS
jgi:Glu-tRNA(Gln) amidotransferase subunit E-like FAD-binding protein